jgi:hypothetical protein
MHPSLLKDIIKKQTGSLDRAIQEAVSNSVDASATSVHVHVTNNKVTITDDGRGFKSEEEVITNFETFGRPHEAAEAKVFGQFRMGRGQLFAHGKNTWKTNEFLLQVDIEKPFTDENSETLGYQLSPLSEPIKGCEVTVELYNPLSYSKLIDIEAAVKRAFRWLPTPVYLNGILISSDPRACEWPHTGDYFVGKFDKSSELHVYNLGVHVQSYPRAKFHNLGGTVISTAAMQLTFSRTEPMDVCPVWKAIRAAMPGIYEEIWKLDKPEKKKRVKKVRKEGDPVPDFSRLQEIPRLTVPEREQRLAAICRDGKAMDEKYDYGQPLLIAFDDKRRWVSVRKFLKEAANGGNRIIFDNPNYPRTDVVRVRRFRLGTYLSSQTLANARMGSDPEGFCKMINKAFNTNWTGVTHEQIDASIRNQEILIAAEGATEAEKALIETVESAARKYLGRWVDVVIAVMGDVSQQLKVTADSKIIISQEKVEALLMATELHDWIQLGIDLLHHYTKIDFQEDSSGKKLPSLERREKVVDFMLEHLPNVFGFAEQCVDRLTDKHDKLSAEYRKCQASIKDTLKHYREAGSNLNLWRGSLEEARNKIDAELNKSQLSKTPLTEAEVMSVA